jgi:glutathione S-transferase
MKLYTYDPAPNPKRLQMFMDYKGIEIETVQVDMMKQEQLGDDYKAINPLGTVPALVLDDGTVLTEVIGACLYLEHLHPERPLMGAPGAEQALVVSWDHLLFMAVFQAVAEIFRNGNPAFAGRALPGALDLEQIPALVERGKLRLAEGWRMIDRQLADNAFLAGDNFSLADIDLMILTEFAGWAAKSEVPAECANIHAWLPRAKEAFAQK